MVWLHNGEKFDDVRRTDILPPHIARAYAEHLAVKTLLMPNQAFSLLRGAATHQFARGRHFAVS